MIQLFIKISAAENFEVDIDQNTRIALNKSLLEITDIQKRTGEFTRTFLLPATDKNNTFFGHWKDFGFQGTYNQYGVQRCLLFDDGSLVIDGNLKLEGYNRKTAQYEVLVYGTLNTISNILGDLRMSVIGGSWLHNHDLATIVSSWSLGVQAGRIVYPLIDYGYGYGYGTYNIGSSSFPVLLEKLIPGLRLYDLIDRLFTSNGITILNFSDFQTIWSDIYVQLIESPPVGQIATKTFEADFSFLGHLTIPAAWTVAPFVIAAGDPDFNNTLSEFTAPYAGTYYFDLHINTHGGSPANVNQVRVWKNNAVQVYFSSQSQDIVNFDRSFSLVLVATDIVEIQIQTSAALPLNYIQFGEGDYWKLTQLVTSATVPPLYDPVADLMKNIRQIDFLREFLLLANYVLIRDANEELSFYLLPLEQWYVEGNILNWTDKLDLDKPIKNSPTNDILSKQVVLSYGDSEDYLNRIFREDNGDNYGTFRDNVDIANAEQKDKKSALFVPYPTDEIPGAVQKLIIPKWFKAEDNFALQKPKNLQLFYYNGLIACNNFWYDYSAAPPIPVSRTDYPQCSNYQLIGGAVTAASKDLNFGYSPPFQNTYTISGIPVDNLYGLYFEDYLRELYDPTNRILDCFMDVIGEDIERLDFNDIIQIDIEGTPLAWRPQKIFDYMISQRKSTKFKLTKATFGLQPAAGNLVWAYVDPASQIVDKLNNFGIANSGMSVASIGGSAPSIYNQGSGFSDDYVVTGMGSAWRSIKPFTFLCWLYEVTNVGTIWLMSKGTNAAREMMIFPYTAARCFIRIQDGGANYFDAYATRHAAAGWYLLAGTYDGSGVVGGLKIYYDGVSQGLTTNTVGVYTDIPLLGPVQSGQLFSDSTVFSTDAHYFNDWRIQNQVLSAAQILKIYNDEKAKFGL